MGTEKFDLVVIGSGPSGQRAAVVAAKHGKKALVVERQLIGGSCLHTGTIPSKTLREAALNPALGRSIRSVMQRAHEVIEDESKVISHQLERNQVTFRQGTASFVDPHTIAIGVGAHKVHVAAEKVVIATGGRPRRPKELPWDSGILYDSDTILGLGIEPKTMLVIGAGVIGCEYASIFQQTGVQVTLIDGRPDFFLLMDEEVVHALQREFARRNLEVLLNTQFSDIEKISTAEGVKARLRLNGVEREFDIILFCQGRTGNFESLNLRAAGLKTDERGQISTNRFFQTEVAHIYAVGDIIGPPALAASSYEQGRLAALHAFTGGTVKFPETFPFGIYTIPEISSVGPTEAELKRRKVKYVVGRALYKELARGKILDDVNGFLKILVHQRTRQIIAVHVIGTGATELVHIGQCVMAFAGTVDFLVENVFNYPTLAEAYKVAAFAALNQLNKSKGRDLS